ncbi:ABC transporter permease [Bacteroidota bacterium]
MLQNYFKIALRNIRKNKIYSGINILGLAVGLTCCVIIIHFINVEMSFDGYHTKADRIYRLISGHSAYSAGARTATTAAGYANDMKIEFPEIEHAVRVFETGASLGYGKDIRDLNVALIDKEVFEVFDFPLIQGNPKNALNALNSLILSRDAAQAYFGRVNVIGETMTLYREGVKYEMNVTAVMENIPVNSHIRFDYIIPFHHLEKEQLTDYLSNNYFTYLLLHDGVSAANLEKKFPDFLEKYRGEGQSKEQSLLLQPLQEIHFDTEIRFDTRSNITSQQNLIIFGFVAVFILLIASINFMNLATARATLRAKEVGMRKVIGAKRGQLIIQFFFESILSSMLAVVLAATLLFLFSPLIRNIITRDLPIDIFDNLQIILVLLFIGLATGILAGIYPAFVLSRFNPITVMKDLSHKGKKGGAFRKTLTIFQFGITVIMLIAMITVYNQITFMNSKELGFEKENVLYIPLTRNVMDNFDSYRQALLRNPDIINASQVNAVPGFVNMSRTYHYPGASKGGEEEIGIYTMLSDPYTLETLGVELIEGRNFSHEIAGDIDYSYILNETAVKELGFENPVGQPFRKWGLEMGQVIGVMKDFHYKSLHRKIEPLILDIQYNWSGRSLVKITGQNISGTISYIEEQFRKYEMALPFRYEFLDDKLETLYSEETELGNLFGYFTVLAIFIACLGTFGMISFTAERRKKEIGIRKVLGASVSQMFIMLWKDFSKLVFWSFIISAPIAYFVMNKWLQNFAYSVGINLAMILFVGIVAQVITLIIVSFQSIKASVANPIDSIKYE